MSEERTILCGANAYEQEYYFNELFSKIPQKIQEELHIMSVLFTEEVGGVFALVFDECGNLNIETTADEDDILYDEVSSGLLINEIKKNKQELLRAINLFYRVVILKEKIED